MILSLVKRFDTLETPMTRGYPAILYAHGAAEPVTVTKLMSIVDKNTNAVLKAKPHGGNDYPRHRSEAAKKQRI